MIKHKTYKYQLLPTFKQRAKLNRHLGSCRFIWNYFLSYNIQQYKANKEKDETQRSNSYSNYYEMCRMLTELKQDKDWLYEIGQHTLQRTIKYLDKAYKDFFSNQRGFPKFKSKKNPTQGFAVPSGCKIKDGKVVIPKFLEGIKYIDSREIKGEIKTATITKNKLGKYFISIVCEEDIQPKPKTGKVVGIDVGLKDFAITSDGMKIKNPRFYRKSQTKLQYISRKFSKYKGHKTKRLLQQLHEHTKNQRKDFLHKVSTEIINQYDTVCLENLNVKGMVKNRHLSKSISDVGWGYFVEYLKYKADWYGKEIAQIDRFFPSSKTCCVCSWVNHNLKLSDRVWECQQCKNVLDRDINAAVNILQQGLNLVNKSGGKELSLKALVAASVGKSDDKCGSLTTA